MGWGGKGEVFSTTTPLQFVFEIKETWLYLWLSFLPGLFTSCEKIETKTAAYETMEEV